MSCSQGCSDPSHFHSLLGSEQGHWLYPEINTSCSSILNESSLNSAKTALRAFHDRADRSMGFVESDGEDHELLFIVPFKETVRMNSMQIISFEDCRGIKDVKLYVNQECFNVDFGNVGDRIPAQLFDRPPSDVLGEIDLPLIPHKFANVDVVAVWITGMEQSVKLVGLGFKGERKGFSRKVVEGIKYEIRPQVKDHPKTKSEQSGGVI